MKISFSVSVTNIFEPTNLVKQLFTAKTGSFIKNTVLFDKRLKNKPVSAVLKM